MFCGWTPWQHLAAFFEDFEESHTALFGTHDNHAHLLLRAGWPVRIEVLPKSTSYFNAPLAYTSNLWIKGFV